MRKLHAGIMALSFIIILVSLFYGISIQNAQDNFLTSHLAIDDGKNYADLEEIPTLGYKAAVITTFFLLIGFSLQIYILSKTKLKQVKNLCIGAVVCFLIIFGFDFLFLFYPKSYNFRDYGMIWVLLSLSTIFINGVSIFARK